MEYVSKLPETKLTNYSQKVLGPNLGTMKKNGKDNLIQSNTKCTLQLVKQATRATPKCHTGCRFYVWQQNTSQNDYFRPIQFRTAEMILNQP